VQLIESNIETLQTNLKNADERQADARARIAQYKKRNAAVPPTVQDEFDRSEGEKIKIQNQIVQKRTDITALNQRYEELKRRFIELKSGSAPQSDKAPPAPSTTAQPAPGTTPPARK
jgi:predicted nuclease with TOPRIM domain